MNEPIVVPGVLAGERVDRAVALLTGWSRADVQVLLGKAAIVIDGRAVSKSHKLVEGSVIELLEEPAVGAPPEPDANVEIDVRHADDDVIVIAKPAGLVVHPGAGHAEGTLVNGLLARFPDIASIGDPYRPGIVHRLDRDTSGVIVVAKTDAVHMALADQFERREVEKEYFAVVAGVPNRDRDVIDLPIGPHPYQREKMAIRRELPTSRKAQTMYEVRERFDGFATLAVMPKTGRTHQIRLHLASIGGPVLCDRLYGGRAEITLGELAHDPINTEVVLARQALHARRLRITHPKSGEPIEFVAPLPADIEAVLTALRTYRAVKTRS